MTNHCFDTLSGYKAATFNPITNNYVVTYVAELQQIDTPDKYITVCEGHNTLITENTLALARLSRKCPENWCEQCQAFDKKACDLIVAWCHKTNRTVGEAVHTINGGKVLSEDESNYVYRKLLELES